MVIEGRERGDRWARNVKAEEKARAQEETKIIGIQRVRA